MRFIMKSNWIKLEKISIYFNWEEFCQFACQFTFVRSFISIKSHNMCTILTVFRPLMNAHLELHLGLFFLPFDILFFWHPLCTRTVINKLEARSPFHSKIRKIYIHSDCNFNFLQWISTSTHVPRVAELAVGEIKLHNVCIM